MSVYRDILDNENNSNENNSNKLQINSNEQVTGDINVNDSAVNTINESLNKKNDKYITNNEHTGIITQQIQALYDNGYSIAKVKDFVNDTRESINNSYENVSDSIADTLATGANNILNFVDDLRAGYRNGIEIVRDYRDNFFKSVGDWLGIETESEEEKAKKKEEAKNNMYKEKLQNLTKDRELTDDEKRLMKKYEDRLKIEKVADIYREFNPYRIDENEEPLIKGFPVIFMTTPFLNLNNIKNNGFLAYLANENIDLLASLSYFESNTSPFIRLLSNRFKEVSMKDVNARTKEMYETFYGMKEMIPTTYIDSVTGDDLSIKYAETKNLSIIKLHKAWLEYMEYLRRGLYVPSNRTINGNYLDFTSSLYYFLLDFDMETILYFSKYTGLAPTSIPYSNLGGDINSRDIIDVDITYSYSFKEDLDPIILSDFNNVSINTENVIVTNEESIKDNVFVDNSKSSDNYVDLYSLPTGEGNLFKNVKVIMKSMESYDESDFHIGSSYAQQKKFVLKLKFF